MRGAAMTVLVDVLAVARSVRIEHELARRGIPFWTKPRNNNLGQPCPMCGGADRFSVNTRKQVWRCRACNEFGGDIISLVSQIDGCGFKQAVEALCGEALQYLPLATPDRPQRAP